MKQNEFKKVGLLLSGLVFLIASNINAKNNSIRLIGGEQANDSQFNSTVLINNGCTGAKISSKHILTAAHCVQDIDISSRQILPTIRSIYRTNSTIEISSSNIIDGNQDRQHFSIKQTHVNPNWFSNCPNGCEYNYALLYPFSPDAAIIEINEELPTPYATVDLNWVYNNEGITIQGYGCETSIYDSRSANRRLKFQSTRTLPHWSLLHDNSSIYQSYDAEQAHKTYLISQGQTYQSDTASICPGDSGGPVYRNANDDLTVVGINAYYTFIDQSGISHTNVHTRLSSGTLFHIDQWLESLLPLDSLKGGANAVIREPLMQAADNAQSIQFNPNAVLQKAIFKDGFVPNSSEVTFSFHNIQYQIQRAESLKTGEARVYFVRHNQWEWVDYRDSNDYNSDFTRELNLLANAHQKIQLNPDAALQKVIFQEGFVPNSDEFYLTIHGQSYVAQRAERLSDGQARVFWTRYGDWGNVKWFIRGK